MAVESKSYLAVVRRFATERPDHPALGILRGEEGLDVWTYGAVWGALCRGSARLTEAGVGPGERVAILGETEPDWGVAELAALHAGAVVVPLDPNHPDPVLQAILTDAGAVAVLCSQRQSPRARSLMPDGIVRTFGELFDRTADAGFDASPAPRDPDAPFLLVYTSGTTGNPKGVTLTERNMTSQLAAILGAVRITEEDTLLSILPLNHMYAQIINLLGPLYLGAAVRFAEEATPQAVRAALARGGVTAFGAVPQFFKLFRDRVFAELRARGAWAERAHALLVRISRLVRRVTGRNIGPRLFPAIHRAFGGRLRMVVSGGSYLDPDLGRQYIDWGFEMLVAYGLTEATAAVTVTPPDDVDVSTVGRAMPGIELRIDDKGEILVRGETVMPGYWNRPDATREMIDDEGWLHTGDLGRLDAKGNVIISGRAREMIVLASGKNVFPTDLDDHYANHELIKEVCVVGLPVEGGGERLHAVVVPDLDEFRRQGIPTIEDYIRFEMETLSLSLPSYQRVRHYTIWREPLPRTPTRKVRRFEVRERLLAQPASGTISRRVFEAGEDDRALLESDAMKAVIAAGRLDERGVAQVHPDMNLEFDLEIDSLARAEMITHLTTRWDARPEDLAAALTPREMVQVLEAGGVRQGASASGSVAAGWSELLRDPAVADEARTLLPSLKGLQAVVFTLVGWFVKVSALFWFRLRVEGTEHLAKLGRPYVLAVNHVSFGDPFLVAAALPEKVRRHVFFIGYAGHLGGRVKGWMSRALRVIPVDAGRRLTRAMQLGAAGLRLGHILMIFPEGERTVDGRLRPFKPGTALLLRETRVPAVPVAIVGAYESWGRDRSFPRPGKVTVVFGEPIDLEWNPAADPDAEVGRVTTRLQEEIGSLLATQS